MYDFFLKNTKKFFIEKKSNFFTLEILRIKI